MQLHSFIPNDNLQVEASARHLGERLKFQFQIHGKILDGPAPGSPKEWPRADELWQTTCFEAFFGEKGQPGYWELNLSPGSHRWNLYRFEDYRNPQPPAPAEDAYLENIDLRHDSLTVDLVRKAPWPKLDLGLCAVIRLNEGLSYFALKHLSDKPDFHRRGGFSLGLSPVVST